MNFSNLPDMENQLKKKGKIVTLEKQIEERVKQDNKKIIESAFGEDSFILETKKPKCRHGCKYNYRYNHMFYCIYDYAYSFTRKETEKETELKRIINMNRS